MREDAEGSAWEAWLLSNCGSTQPSDGLRPGSPRTVSGLGGGCAEEAGLKPARTKDGRAAWVVTGR